MNSWIDENSMFLLIVLASTAAVLLLLTLTFLILWRFASRRRSKEHDLRVDSERERIDLELSLAEQTGRLRIIRELHEVSVHDMSVLISQADGARFAGEADPAVAVRATSVIGEAARSALADLRRVMSLVREGEAAVETQPELKSARDLFRVMREAGLDIDFTETGKKFQLKIDDDGARNEVRRSGGDPNQEARARAYDIDEDLHALTDVVHGAGMTEMRERTELFGGVFSAIPVPGVGFSITASFPTLRYHNGIHGVNLES